MLISLLVLLLLFGIIYVVYRMNLNSNKKNENLKKEEHHYTFKI